MTGSRKILTSLIWSDLFHKWRESFGHSRKSNYITLLSNTIHVGTNWWCKHLHKKVNQKKNTPNYNISNIKCTSIWIQYGSISKLHEFIHTSNFSERARWTVLDFPHFFLQFGSSCNHFQAISSQLEWGREWEMSRTWTSRVKMVRAPCKLLTKSFETLLNWLFLENMVNSVNHVSYN